MTDDKNCYSLTINIPDYEYNLTLLFGIGLMVLIFKK